MNAEPFQTYWPSDLLAMPRPKWLVEPFIKEGGITELFGAFGVYKSFLACSWAAEAPGVAIYITAEGSPHDQGLSLTAWERASEREAAVASIPHAVNLLVDDDVNSLAATFRVFNKTPRLLVVDTLARNMAGGNENSTDDMGRFVGAIDRLRCEFKCSVCVIHHSGHEHADRSRGSSAWAAAVDVSVKLAKTDSKAQLEAKVSCAKMRGAAKFDDRIIRLEPLHDTLVVVDAVAVDEALRRNVQEYLTGHPAASQNEVEREVHGRAGRVRTIYQEVTAKVRPVRPTPGRTPDIGASRGVCP
ncbi:MAG TPA: AAA family ATPase [Gaiellales bacterium]|nr:AAA family ATPase [Gaiellales bacterium]